MNTPVSQKRKSLPIEKKLEVYEFEVDENEPKIKQKKKRGPKPGTKNNVRWGNTKRGTTKSPVKNKVIQKVIKTKNLPNLIQKDNAQKQILSTNNSSSPFFDNKRRVDVGKLINNAPVYSTEQKENQIKCNDQVLKEVSVEMISAYPRRSLRGNKNFNSTNEKNEVFISEFKESSIGCKAQISNLNVGVGTEVKSVDSKRSVGDKNSPILNKTDRVTPLKSNKNSTNQNSVVKDSEDLKDSLNIKQQNTFENKIGQPKKYKGKVSKLFDKENMRNSVEVPVLFHNHQEFSPEKTKTEKPGFTAMSDDESTNKSFEGKTQIDHFFCPTSSNHEFSTTVSSFYDTTYDHQISVSTPVKYNKNDTCDSSIHDCFGFDEIFEEPLVSPIKITGEDHSSNHQISAKSLTSKHPIVEKKDEVPVSQVIRLLKYGTEDVETTSKSSSNSVLPIFDDVSSEEEKLNKIMKSNTPAKIVKPMPRRSYERPSYLIKRNDSGGDDDSSEEDNPKKIIPKKKHPGPSKKEQDEMQKWIKAFNSQCQEIDKFDLVVE